MNYYHIFVLLQYHLIICSCASLVPLFDFYKNNNDQSSINKSCQHSITYTQMIILLSRNICQLHETSNDTNDNNARTKRDVDAGNTDIKALQSTINDHRVMIEYLFNSSINETILAKALSDHSRTAPSFRSWRDLVDIFCIGLVIIILLYLFICRTGCSASDQLFACLFRPVLNRLQQPGEQEIHPQHPQQQRTPSQRRQKQFISTLPTAPPTTSEYIKSLSKIADSVTNKQ